MPKIQKQGSNLLPKRKEIHDYDKVLETTVQKIKDNAKISKTNKEAILKYKETIETIGKRPVRKPTAIKSLQVLYDFFQFCNKPVMEVTKLDVEEYTQEFAKRKYEPSTSHKHLSCIKKFFRVQYGLKKGQYPECVDWIVLDSDKNHIQPNQLLEQAEVKSMIEHNFKNPRNQALIALLNDCGLRIGEAGCLDLKHISEENNYLVITVPQSKTVPRTIISYLAKPYIKKWLAVHPKKSGDDSPLFIELGTTKGFERARYDALRKAVKESAKEVGITKRVYPHLFRHMFNGRSGQYFHYAQRTYWNGWSGGISDTYTHFDYKQCIKPYFEMIKGESNIMLPKECKCGYLNPNVEFCEKCGQDLKHLNILNKSPEKKTALIKEILESADVEIINKVLDSWWDKKQKDVK